MICLHHGNWWVAYKAILLMLNKPREILQRRLVAHFFSSFFSAAKGINMSILQINELQARVNSMGKLPSIVTVLSKIDDTHAHILTMQLSQSHTRA